jgi:hypothetical protein
MLIHRYWTGPGKPLHEPWLGNCIHSLNPGVDINNWKDRDLPSEYSKFYNDTQVRGRDAYKHKANIVRLLVLLDFGGAWYDYDVVPLLPVTSLPVSSVGSHRGLCNSFMYFERGDERLEAALDGIMEQPPSDRPSTVVSGSTFLRSFFPEVHYLEYPFGPDGQLLTGSRPFAIHLGDGL